MKSRFVKIFEFLIYFFCFFPNENLNLEMLNIFALLTEFFYLPHQANIQKIFLISLLKAQFSDLDLELPIKITHLF